MDEQERKRMSKFVWGPGSIEVIDDGKSDKKRKDKKDKKN